MQSRSSCHQSIEDSSQGSAFSRQERMQGASQPPAGQGYSTAGFGRWERSGYHSTRSTDAYLMDNDDDHVSPSFLVEADVESSRRPKTKPVSTRLARGGINIPYGLRSRYQEHGTSPVASFMRADREDSDPMEMASLLRVSPGLFIDQRGASPVSSISVRSERSHTSQR